MPMITNFERDDQGKYLSIQQSIDGKGLVEGSTFVAFDSVAFARATGQTAMVQIELGYCEDIMIRSLKSADGCGVRSAKISSDSFPELKFLAPDLIFRMPEHYGENTDDPTRPLIVNQDVHRLKNCEYIGDGPFHLASGY